MLAQFVERVVDALDGDDGHALDGLLGRVGLGYHRQRKAQFGRLAQPFLAARRRTDLAGQADFAKHHEAARQRLVAHRRVYRQQHGQVGRRFGDLDAADPLMNTSWSKAAMPAWRCSTASSIASRFCSNPTDRRRALGKWLASTSAWISTSSGRVPSCVTITHEPGTWLSCCDRNSADGFDTPFSPFSVIANTPISLIAPKRFLIARTRRKLEWLSPSKYSTVSTMCSSTREPASAPSLVTWPTRMMVMPVCLATRVSWAAHSRTWATEPGAELSASEYTV